MVDEQKKDAPKRQEYQTIGKRLPRHDAWDKVFGSTVYAGDFEMPGMLHAKVLRSKYPAAKILSVDTTEARELSGVEAVLTAKDVPNNETVTRFGQTHAVGGFEGLYRVLANKKVRFLGEAIALVAAETEEIAEKATELIKVEYEPLDGVFDPLEAMKPGAYQVGEEESNIVCSYKVRKGNIEEGFAKADVIVENTYHVPHVEHAYLEPDAGVAWVDHDGVITIRSSIQVMEHFRGVADVLGIPHNKVRIIVPMVGGGFGSKEDIVTETYLALLTYKTKKPVKLVYTREEAILATSKRHPYVLKYKTGATRDGKLVAMEADIVSDAGAYVYLSPWVLLYTTVNAAGPYDITHVKVDTTSVLTNNIYTSANRGFGAPQACFAYESQLDELAKRLNMTPLELRKKNYLHTGDALATGRVLEHAVETEATAEKALEALGEQTKPRSPYEKIGQGIASSMMSYGRMMFLHDTSRSYVSIEMDGSVTVRCGVQDIGGGQESSLASIASETLGVPMEDIRVFSGDTALTPIAGTTTATRQLYMSGNATLKAATEVRKNLLVKAGEMLEANPEDLEMRDRKVYVKGSPTKNLPLDKVVKVCAADGISLFNAAQFNAPFRELMDFKTGQGQVFSDFTFGTHAMEVAVDTETGHVEVLKIFSCYDVGQAINPLSVEGQLEGGALYGLGYGQMEEVIMDKGVNRTLTFAQYLIPTSVDAPDVKTILLESGGGVGPFGAKGVGEPSCVSAAPAFANAVCNAIGVRIFDLPLMPEKIVKALKRVSTSGKS